MNARQIMRGVEASIGVRPETVRSKSEGCWEVTVTPADPRFCLYWPEQTSVTFDVTAFSESFTLTQRSPR